MGTVMEETITVPILMEITLIIGNSRDMIINIVT